MTSFFERLQQRKIVQWALAYIAAAFALIQVGDIVGQRFGWPEQAMRMFIVVAAVGFFVTLIVAWYHGERGAQHVAGTELLILALVLAIGGVVAWKLGPPSTPKAVVAATDAPPQSVAVLPLINESGDPKQDYFSDGLSEELISALAQVRSLKVIGRSSSFRFRGKDQDDIAAIAATLGVATLLEGTVRKQNGNVRIVASLIRASDSSAMWSQTYDRELKDVFAVQTDIATSVAGALKTTLLGKTLESADKPPSGNLDAYNALLQGRFYAARRNRADYLKALDYYQQAIKLDPDYAMAYARLANAQQWFVDWIATGEERKATTPQAQANAEKALALDPQSAVAMGVLGINQAWSQFDLKTGEATLRRALQLDPTNAETIYQHADVIGCLGRLDESVAIMRKVLAMEPLNAQFHFNMGQFLLGSNRLDEAEAELHRAIDLQPEAAGFRLMLVQVYIKQGRFDEALAASADEPDAATRRSELAQVYAANGDTVKGQAQLDDMLRLDGESNAFYIAEVYTLRGDADKAFEWLERGYTIRDPGTTTLYEDPIVLPALRNDPRMKAFAKKIGVPDPDTVPDPWANK
ncbi:MAG TPA: tetratricopeptide repeat protein [Rudaea sp.]|nr:tetratricopeptide repeat protein [Rudaea sp.]